MHAMHCRGASQGKVHGRGRRKGNPRMLTYCKMAVHVHKLLVRIQHAVDELGYTEQLHLHATQDGSHSTSSITQHLLSSMPAI